jgi:succinate-semialdehyde dehydrogenase/glutarate-semialdehyde dehydrogenase
MKSINPATGEVMQEYQEYHLKEVDGIIEDAHRAWKEWRTRSFEERSRVLWKAAEILGEKKEQFAKMITKEMGKPIVQSRAEIEKCIWVCEYYAENAKEILEDEQMKSDGSQAFVRFQSLGVVLAVMPWNYPFWQVFRFLAPALMAGNTALLKHASNVSGCAWDIESIFLDAGAPLGLFRTLLLSSRKVEHVIRHDHVQAVTLTGSEKAGSIVGSQAGSEIKHAVMELGGSDPFIVLDDVDVEHCAVQAVNGRFQNTGQSCIAAKRFIVNHEVYDAFVASYVKIVESQKMGDPMDETVNVGPLAKEAFVDEIDELVQDALSKGAKLLTGGKRRDGPGYFYEPTVVAEVTPEMKLYYEETFGPVATIYKVSDDDEAVEIANATRFGLASSVWSQDTERAMQVADKIEAGAVFINGIVKSDPRLPFGGIKKSGFGRELSTYGIKEFCNVKTYWVK